VAYRKHARTRAIYTCVNARVRVEPTGASGGGDSARAATEFRTPNGELAIAIDKYW
jgi:hypothetical protein